MKNVYQHLLYSALLFLIGWLFSAPVYGQKDGPAIEQWRSFSPYFQVNALATDGSNEVIYCATEYGFFTYNRKDGSLESYSKVNGMHDIGMNDIAYDEQTGCALLAYTNGNIDIFKNNQFTNIPDLKNSQISGNKSIYAVTAQDGVGYLSTGIGLLVVNLPKKEVKYTVPFYSGSLFASVYNVVIQQNKIYAATSVGLFRTSIDNAFIQDYSSWNKLTNQVFSYLSFADNQLYAGSGDSVFVYRNNDSSFHLFYKANQEIAHLDADNNAGLWVSQLPGAGEESGHCYLLNAGGQKIDSLPCHSPQAVLSLSNGEIWYADNSNYQYPKDNGLRKKINATESESYTPDGPVSGISFDISAYDGVIWVAHGGHGSNWGNQGNRAMFSVYKDDHWKNFSWLSNNDWVQDFIRILYDPNTGHTFAGSLTGGLTDVAPDQNFHVYNEDYLPETYGNPGLYSVSGLTLDPSGNLWISSNGGIHELTVKTTDGHWYPMKQVSTNNGGSLPHSAADVIVDDYGQLWFITTQSNGVVVYDPNGTPENNNDDRYRLLKTGEGNGGLPTNNALSIAKTKDGAIWIGTSNGIGIVNCPGQVIDRQCEADQPVIKVDEFNGLFFSGQAISALAVDGANRKWIGTGNGLWLLNTEGGGSEMKTVYRFTTENSPLPSNQIQRINIDPVTGDVYISTDKGFVSFRSTATEASATSKSDLLVYPNPVPSGYQGMIAVRGVPDNADVRFTDISGKLVYKTNAFGGQAVWNGKDYTGHKVQSGVYLVFIVGKDGTEKMTTKIIVQN